MNWCISPSSSVSPNSITESDIDKIVSDVKREMVAQGKSLSNAAARPKKRWDFLKAFHNAKKG